MPKSLARRERWTPEEDEKIEELQILYGTKWTKVLAVSFPTRSTDAIRKRWSMMSKKLWTVNEDKQLIDTVNCVNFETKADMKIWLEAISNPIVNKSINQCIDRWFNILRPRQAKVKWEPEEDKKLVVLCSHYGNRWKTIEHHFPRRSNNKIKNRWQMLSNMNRNNNDVENARKDIKKRASAMLKSHLTSRLLLQESNDIHEPISEQVQSKSSYERDINDREAAGKITINRMKNEKVESTSFHENKMFDGDISMRVQNERTYFPTVLDLSEEDIAFLGSL